MKSPDKNAFIQAGQAGKHSIWRYLASIILLFFAVLIMNIFAGVVVAAATGTTDIEMMPPGWVFLLAMVTFPAALIALLFAVHFIHHRNIVTLITPNPRPDWRWLAVSALVWFGLSALGDLVMALFITPGNYQFTFNPVNFFGFAFLAIFLLPLQTSTEELFFRGYLLQGFGRLSKSAWLPALFTSMLFAGLHTANPEVAQYGFWTMMAFYFSIGLLLAWVTLYTEGLEAALGLHFVNNLYAALFVTFPGSALQTPAIFSMGQYDPILSLAVFYIMAIIYAVIIRQFKRRFSREHLSELS